jgi:hypothetical protein
MRFETSDKFKHLHSAIVRSVQNTAAKVFFYGKFSNLSNGHFNRSFVRTYGKTTVAPPDQVVERYIEVVSKI